jgi:hypothetical protein
MPHDSTTGCDLLVWGEDPAKIPFKTQRAWGHVVNIKDCPHKGWGKEERPQGAYRFKVVHVPDRTKADLDYLQRAHYAFWTNSPEDAALGYPPQKKKFLKRRHRINIVALGAVDRAAITKDADLYCTIPWARLEPKITDDVNQLDLSNTYPQIDRAFQRRVDLAEIRRGVQREPPGWALNKHLFSGVDTTAEELKLVADIELGRRPLPPGWSFMNHRVG